MQRKIAITRRSFSNFVQLKFINLVDYLRSIEVFDFLTCARWIMQSSADWMTTIFKIWLYLVAAGWTEQMHVHMKLPKIQNSWIFGGFVCFLFSIYLLSFGRFTPGQNLNFKRYKTPPIIRRPIEEKPIP